MAAPALPIAPQRTAAARLDVEIVVPVYNEEHALEASIRRLHEFLTDDFPLSWQVVIADNASTDLTLRVARRLSAELDGVAVLHLRRKGRGRALRAAWVASPARVVCYMDVDLSTDLDALLPLVAPLISGHSDLAVGSRLAGSARVERGLKREFISRSYNLILRRALRVGFSDAQCGFKAIRRTAARELLPLVHDQEWFFDTELLTVAERAGLRIHEVPVDWVDDPDSRVDIVRTALDDLRGVVRLGTSLARGRLPLREVGVRLGRVSAEAGAGRLGLQVAMFHVAGPMVSNLLALLLTAIANTAANRRFSFGVRGPEHRLRHQLQGLAVFVLGLTFTSTALWLMPDTHPTLEVAVLTVVNLVVTALRFVAMKAWIFVRRPVSRSAAQEARA